MGAAGVVAPILAWRVFDATKSYPFSTAGVLAVAAFIVLLLTRRWRSLSVEPNFSEARSGRLKELHQRPTA